MRSTTVLKKIYNEEWNSMLINNPSFTLLQFGEIGQTFYNLKSTLSKVRLETRQ